MCFNAESRIESRGSFDEEVDDEEEEDDEDYEEEEEDGEEDITGEADAVEVTGGAELVETNLLVVFLVYVTARLKKDCEKILLEILIEDIVEEWLLVVGKIQTSSK